MEGASKPPIGLISYADIAAGRSRSSSRHASPQTKAPSPARTLRQAEAKLFVPLPRPLQSSQSQVEVSKGPLKAVTMRQTENPPADGIKTDNSYIEKQIKMISEAVPRRGRSPTRKTQQKLPLKATESIKSKVPSLNIEVSECENRSVSTSEKKDIKDNISLQKKLAPVQERRGRSPSPMWIPGSTSYADILRGTSATRGSAEPDERIDPIVPLKIKETRALSKGELSKKDEVKMETVEAKVADKKVDDCDKPCDTSESICGLPTEMRSPVEAASWADQPLDDYDTINETINPSQQGIYDYVHPMPEIVGFINPPLNTYPVDPYMNVYAQPIQQLTTISLSSYDPSMQYVGQHFVPQQTYVSPEIYHQGNVITNVPDNATILLQQPETNFHSNPQENNITISPILSTDATKNSLKSTETEKTFKNPMESEQILKIKMTEEPNHGLESAEKTDTQKSDTGSATFSWAQILSQGLSPSEHKSLSSKEQEKEKNNLKDKTKQANLSNQEYIESSNNKLESVECTVEKSENWDTIKKKDAKRKQTPNQKQQDNLKKNKKDLDKAKTETSKTEKLIIENEPPKKDLIKLKSGIKNSTEQKKEKSLENVPSENLNATPKLEVDLSNEKRKKQKKKKNNNSNDDEIDKALKEIQDMDKQKLKISKEKSKDIDQETKSKAEEPEKISFKNNVIEKNKSEQSVIDKKEKNKKLKANEDVKVLNENKIPETDRKKIMSKTKTDGSKKSESNQPPNKKNPENKLAQVNDKDKLKTSENLKDVNKNTANKDNFETVINENQNNKSEKQESEINTSKSPATEKNKKEKILKVTDDLNARTREKEDSRKDDSKLTGGKSKATIVTKNENNKNIKIKPIEKSGKSNVDNLPKINETSKVDMDKKVKKDAVKPTTTKIENDKNENKEGNKNIDEISDKLNEKDSKKSAYKNIESNKNVHGTKNKNDKIKVTSDEVSKSCVVEKNQNKESSKQKDDKNKKVIPKKESVKVDQNISVEIGMNQDEKENLKFKESVKDNDSNIPFQSKVKKEESESTVKEGNSKMVQKASNATSLKSEEIKEKNIEKSTGSKDSLNNSKKKENKQQEKNISNKLTITDSTDQSDSERKIKIESKQKILPEETCIKHKDIIKKEVVPEQAITETPQKETTEKKDCEKYNDKLSTDPLKSNLPVSDTKKESIVDKQIVPITKFYDKLEEELIFDECKSDVQMKSLSEKINNDFISSEKSSNKKKKGKREPPQKITDSQKSLKKEEPIQEIQACDKSQQDKNDCDLKPGKILLDAISKIKLVTDSAEKKDEKLQIYESEKDQETPIFGSVQSRKKYNKIPNLKEATCDNFNPIAQNKQEVQSCLKERPYLNETIKDYQADYHALAEAENDLHQFYKIEKVLENTQPPKSTDIKRRSPSIERIVQQSKMKQFQAPSEEKKLIKNKLPEKSKEDVLKESATVQQDKILNEMVETINKAAAAVHLKADDAWMDLLDEPITIDDDFDDDGSPAAQKQEVSSKTVSQTLDTAAENIQAPAKITESKDKAAPAVHLKADDAWMDLLDEPITIDDDFDDNDDSPTVEKQEVSSKAVSQTLDTAAENIQAPAKITESKDKAAPAVHLKADDAWMDLLDEPITIDDDFDDNDGSPTVEKQEVSSKAVSQTLDTAAENIQAPAKITESKDKAAPAVHLKADDAWMDLLDEPITIDDDFDDNDGSPTVEKQEISSELNSNLKKDDLIKVISKEMLPGSSKSAKKKQKQKVQLISKNGNKSNTDQTSESLSNLELEMSKDKDKNTKKISTDKKQTEQPIIVLGEAKIDCPKKSNLDEEVSKGAKPKRPVEYDEFGNKEPTEVKEYERDPPVYGIPVSTEKDIEDHKKILLKQAEVDPYFKYMYPDDDEDSFYFSSPKVRYLAGKERLTAEFIKQFHENHPWNYDLTPEEEEELDYIFKTGSLDLSNFPNVQNKPWMIEARARAEKRMKKDVEDAKKDILNILDQDLREDPILAEKVRELEELCKIGKKPERPATNEKWVLPHTREELEKRGLIEDPQPKPGEEDFAYLEEYNKPLITIRPSDYETLDEELETDEEFKNLLLSKGLGPLIGLDNEENKYEPEKFENENLSDINKEAQTGNINVEKSLISKKPAEEKNKSSLPAADSIKETVDEISVHEDDDKPCSLLKKSLQTDVEKASPDITVQKEKNNVEKVVENTETESKLKKESFSDSTQKKKSSKKQKLKLEKLQEQQKQPVKAQTDVIEPIILTEATKKIEEDNLQKESSLKTIGKPQNSYAKVVGKDLSESAKNVPNEKIDYKSTLSDKPTIVKEELLPQIEIETVVDQGSLEKVGSDREEGSIQINNDKKDTRSRRSRSRSRSLRRSTERKSEFKDNFIEQKSKNNTRNEKEVASIPLEKKNEKKIENKNDTHDSGNSKKNKSKNKKGKSYVSDSKNIVDENKIPISSETQEPIELKEVDNLKNREGSLEKNEQSNSGLLEEGLPKNDLDQTSILLVENNESKVKEFDDIKSCQKEENIEIKRDDPKLKDNISSGHKNRSKKNKKVKSDNFSHSTIENPEKIESIPEDCTTNKKIGEEKIIDTEKININLTDNSSEEKNKIDKQVLSDFQKDEIQCKLESTDASKINDIPQVINENLKFGKIPHSKKQNKKNKKANNQNLNIQQAEVESFNKVDENLTSRDLQKVEPEEIKSSEPKVQPSQASITAEKEAEFKKDESAEEVFIENKESKNTKLNKDKCNKKENVEKNFESLTDEKKIENPSTEKNSLIEEKSEVESQIVASCSKNSSSIVMDSKKMDAAVIDKQSGSIKLEPIFEQTQNLSSCLLTDENNSKKDRTSPKRVTFYIADEMVVVSPERQKTPEIDSEEKEESEDEEFEVIPSWASFIAEDTGFWPNKHLYQEAECEHFEALALKQKKSADTSKQNTQNKKDDNDDDDDDGGSSGKDEKSKKNLKSTSTGSPQTERLIADLPGGIGSWSDDSTYLLPEIIIDDDEQETFTNTPVHPDPKPPSSNFQPSPIGKKSSSSVEMQNTIGESQMHSLEMKTQDYNTLTIKEKIKHNVDDLYLVLAQLEGALRTLSRENMQSMISALSTILADLRYYNQEAGRIDNALSELPQDTETTKLQASIGEIRKSFANLLSQAEQGQSTLELAREDQEIRKQEIRSYKQCLEETEAWIRHVSQTLSDQITIPNHQALEEEISFRLQRLIELQAMDEVGDLAEKIKDTLQNLKESLHKKQQQAVDGRELSAQIEAPTSVGAALDFASSSSPPDGSSPSLADVSLQTGQSLVQDIENKTKTKLVTKETSTEPFPISSACQTHEIETINLSVNENQQPITESIKVFKSTDGEHDVIEIATKNIMPFTNQEQVRRERQVTDPEDIVVDMKYQDAQKQENITSELNIQHTAPQAFETVLVEPDDVTTEVVVDSDGTKRIIVRKLRRTLVTSRQTMQQHVSQLSSAIGGGPPVVQAFSEATMRGQQVTVTRTKPDGTIEMATKQTYGGKVTTGKPDDQLHVEEYESTPKISRRIIQGDLQELSPKPLNIDQALVEGAEYSAKTSTVHAVVQQVTRKVIRKTRRIIRKVTIIDGKEVTSEEIVEEPEDVEIDEQDIPHISINVVKSEEKGPFTKEEILRGIKDPNTLQRTEEKDETVTVLPTTEPKILVHKPTIELEIEESLPQVSEKLFKKSKKKKSKKGSSTLEDSLESNNTYTIEEKLPLQKSEPLGTDDTLDKDDNLSVKQQKVQHPYEKHENAPLEVTVPNVDFALESQLLIDSEKYDVLQTPVEESIDSTTKDVSSLDSTSIDDIPTMIKTSCKFEDAPVGTSIESHDFKVISGTVDLVQRTDDIDSRTVDVVDHAQSVSYDIPQKEIKLMEVEGITSGDEKLVVTTEDTSELDKPLEKSFEDHTQTIMHDVPSDNLKIDISLSVQNQDDTQKGPLVSVESHIDQTEIDSLNQSVQTVKIVLPAEIETVTCIENKSIQLSEVNPLVEKDREILPEFTTVESKDLQEKDTPVSRKSKAKKKNKEKSKGTEKTSDEESSTSAVTTTLGESIEIDVLQSDSSKCDQPEPDVYEVTESSDASPQKVDIFEGDGYEADHRTTVEEMPLEIDLNKKKKKKKKKQKIELEKEDSEDLPKSKANGEESPLEAISSEGKENKMSKKSTKKRKRRKEDITVTGSDEAYTESSDIQMNEADTQTMVETRDMSAGDTDPDIFTSSDQPKSMKELIEKSEQETQTLEVSAKSSPELKIDITKTEEIALQTSPNEENLTSLPPVTLQEAESQTPVLEIGVMEIQTSPTESKKITEEAEVQTSTGYEDNFDQQTTLPSTDENKLKESGEIAVQTEISEPMPEKVTQSSKATSPEIIEIDITNNQTNLGKNLQTIETQTTPELIPSIITQETEMQTTPEKKLESMIQTSPMESIESLNEIESLPSNITEKQTILLEGETQTAVPEEKFTSETSVQTKTDEIISTNEESVQIIPDTSEISSQTSHSEANIFDKTISTEEILKQSEEPDATEPDSAEMIHQEIQASLELPVKEELISEKSLTEQQIVPEIKVTCESFEAPDEDSADMQEIISEFTPSQVESETESVKTAVADDFLPHKEKAEKQSESFKHPQEEEPTSIISIGSEADYDVKTTSSDTTSTADTLFEIQIQATVEIGGTTSPESTQDSSQDMTITEEPTDDQESKAKRQKRKRQRHRTVEVRESIQHEEKPEIGLILGHVTSDEDNLSQKIPHTDISREDSDTVKEVRSIDSAPVESMDTVEEPLLITEVTPLVKEKSVLPLEADSKSHDRKKAQKNILQKSESTKFMLEKVKNPEKAERPSHLSNLLHISTLENPISDKSFEDKTTEVSNDLNALKGAIEERNIVIIEQTFVTVVETISTWLETIESRIFLGRECPSGPSHDEAQSFVDLKDEVNHVGEQIKELEKILDTVENDYPQQDQQDIRKCIKALENQAKVIEEIANEGEMHLTVELARWDEFLNGVNNTVKSIQEQWEQLNNLLNSESPVALKLEKLDDIDNENNDNLSKINKLFNEAKGLLQEYPGKEIPSEMISAEETARSIEHTISLERDKLVEIQELAKEYEQTLHEFAHITNIAENLLESPISVLNLNHLQEEMQRHRKFFVNLNHCKAILESLEDNLDSETKALHADLHQKLHNKATRLLDEAAIKAQQMSLAASRWVVLEQGIKEENGWLQVAHQRVPDLKNVTSNEYEQYISLYQNLSLDIANHHGRLLQLLDLARGLQNLINIEDPDVRYGEAFDVIVKLQENVDFSLRRLLAFRENWNNQEMLVNRLENWMSRAERDLATVNDPTGGHMRQFWELKAQYEVHNNMRTDAGKCFEHALRTLPLADEILQRQFHGEMQKRWNSVTDKIKRIQDSVRSTISSEDVPANEKLNILERELIEVRKTIDEFHGVMKTEEELEMYVERLSVLFERVYVIQDELGRLGFLPAAESERVGFLVSTARHLESVLGEELDAARQLKERLQILKRGIGRIRKAHMRHSLVLDQCEGCERQSSDVVAAAVERAQGVSDELAQLWQEIMGLRQLLHTLPTSMRVSVSPMGMERDISGLQDRHEELETRCGKLVALLRSRLALWRRFERQLEMVQQSVQEADYMMELLTVQGTVDYERLLKATERLEGLNGEFVEREVLISELRTAAEPLRESCAAEVSERVDAVVNEAVQAWEDTRSELGSLCTRYQHAVRLWQQYRDSSAAVKAWVDTQMGSVANLPPEEALNQVKVCEDTLAEHKERLAELRGLVAQIASDVGLDASGPLQTEVEALGRKLEDVRETLSTLADTADARALNNEITRDDLCQTKNFLDSVHQSITSVGQNDSKEQLYLLRNQLLALTRTEPQLQTIKERALEITPTREPSIVEVLQLWQRVFRDTFQQYHRLSMRLVRSQDVAEALRLWQEYLSHVQDFLSSSVPGDYNGLAEVRNLCEVHKNLLTDQQNLIQMVRSEDDDKGDISVTEQFNALTNLHNESLAKIMDRHNSVRDRLGAWEKYRIDQNKLMDWLKEVDREKSRLQLRFISVRRVDKILDKIDTLLKKLPSGEAQIDALQKQQEALLKNCDEAIAVSVRMEHAANVQRISNIRASLETWKDFILKIKGLNDKHSTQTAKVTSIFQELVQKINEIAKSIPSSLSDTRKQMDSLQQYKNKLITCVSDLETLGVTTEQLKECLSPADMKSLNQQNFILWQQHGELEHKLALLAYQLGERCSLLSRWDIRSERLIIWMKDTEIRMNNCDTANLDEPEEALKRLECEVQAEMALKQRELEWVQNNGLDLINIAESNEKEKLEKKLNEVNERWNRLVTAGKTRANKITDLMQTMSNLLKRLSEIRAWLSGVESQLSEPYTIESASTATIEKKLRDHEQLQKTIEAESGNIGEVLNLCEILLSDCDVWKTSFNTDAIKNGMEELERRWKVTCVKSAERKRKIILTGKLLEEVETLTMEYEEWLLTIESELKVLEKDIHDLSKDNTDKCMSQAQKIQDDITARHPAQEILEQCYCRLAKGGLEPDNLKSLTSNTRLLIDRWNGLLPKISTIITALQKDQKTYREFISAHGASVIGLTQVDVSLTQLEHLPTADQKTSARRQLQQLSDVETELTRQSNTLRRADELALLVMREGHPDDIANVQELVDEYQKLYKNIHDRIDALRLKIEAEDRREVDEAVQVETLKFETDTGVQVDTLPKLMRMTSFDAYLIELESAISECRVALDTLETAVLPEPTPGTGLSTAARAIAKLIGSCQSSIELVKHLHSLLSEEEKLAKSIEVEDLTARYEDLLTRARARENQIRELNDGGRLTCPLCSHRNWAQLDNDLWRLEKWLEFAEGTQSEQYTPPSDIEKLEDVIQDHHEFLLDLDSHKSIIVSLNIVGAHLADHTEDVDRATELRDRLACANVRWDKVCQLATQWQNQLQSALMGNQQFHRIIEELLEWLQKTEVVIRASEPIDLTEGKDILQIKYDKFKEMQGDLERCEPRVLSLQEAANHLLEERGETRARLQELRLRWQSLRRLTGIYVLKLGSALGLDPRDVGLAVTSTSLAVLSRNLLDDAASGTSQVHDTRTAKADDGDRTVLTRGYHFIGRVLRASLPIQAVMLLLLGAASLVPSVEEDYSCMFSNNLARSFTPLVQYPNGPPPL